MLYGAPPPLPGGGASGYASATDTTTTAVIPAPGKGFQLNVTRLVIYNSHATTTTGVDIYSGTTKKWGPIPAPFGGGSVVQLDPPLEMNDNEALGFKALGSVTTIYVSALGYKSAAMK